MNTNLTGRQFWRGVAPMIFRSPIWLLTGLLVFSSCRVDSKLTPTGPDSNKHDELVTARKSGHSSEGLRLEENASTTGGISDPASAQSQKVAGYDVLNGWRGPGSPPPNLIFPEIDVSSLDPALIDQANQLVAEVKNNPWLKDKVEIVGIRFPWQYAPGEGNRSGADGVQIIVKLREDAELNGYARSNDEKNGNFLGDPNQLRDLNSTEYQNATAWLNAFGAPDAAYEIDLTLSGKSPETRAHEFAVSFFGDVEKNGEFGKGNRNLQVEVPQKERTISGPFLVQGEDGRKRRGTPRDLPMDPNKISLEDLLKLPENNRTAIPLTGDKRGENAGPKFSELSDYVDAVRSSLGATTGLGDAPHPNRSPSVPAVENPRPNSSVSVNNPRIPGLLNNHVGGGLKSAVAGALGGHALTVIDTVTGMETPAWVANTLNYGGVLGEAGYESVAGGFGAGAVSLLTSGGTLVGGMVGLQSAAGYNDFLGTKGTKAGTMIDTTMGITGAAVGGYAGAYGGTLIFGGGSVAAAGAGAAAFTTIGAAGAVGFASFGLGYAISEYYIAPKITEAYEDAETMAYYKTGFEEGKSVTCTCSTQDCKPGYLWNTCSQTGTSQFIVPDAASCEMQNGERFGREINGVSSYTERYGCSASDSGSAPGNGGGGGTTSSTVSTGG